MRVIAAHGRPLNEAIARHVPGETADTGDFVDSGVNERAATAADDPQIPEDAMRLVDVVLAGVLLGLTLGLVHTGLPGFGARAGDPQAAAADCGQSKCQRVTWLRTPLMRRTYSE